MQNKRSLSPGSVPFLLMLFLENEEQPSKKKTSEQCFSQVK